MYWRQCLYARLLKPSLYRAVAATALVLSVPLLLAIAAAIRLNLGAPILFSQWRPGKDGRLFRLYKFRSMSDERTQGENSLGTIGG